MPYSPEMSSDLENLVPNPALELGEEIQAGAENDRLREELDEVKPIIEAAASAEARAATETVLAHDGVSALRGAGSSVKEIWRTFDAEALKIARSQSMNARGKNEATTRAAEKRDRAIGGIAERVMSVQGDRVLSAFPSPSFGSPRQEVAAEVSVIFAAFPHATAADFTSDAIAVLRRGIDPALSSDERFRANIRLKLAYLPLSQRRATSPEHHAKPLASLNADLSTLIRSHLDTVLRAGRHRVAVHLVSQARRDFTWLTNTLVQQGAWDDVLTAGAPSFWPGE